MKWGVDLRGRENDLEHWRDMLRPPFDPHVEVVDRGGGKLYILSSKAFQKCTDEEEVREVALPLLRRLNALATIERNCGPVEERAVAKIGTDGSILELIVSSSFHARGRSRAFFAGVAVQDGREIYDPPQPSFVQAKVANCSDKMNAALEHFSRSDNWHDLYMAFEAVEDICVDRDGIPNKCNVSSKKVSLCAENINYHRHHKKRPRREVWSFSQSKAFVGGLLKALLQSASEP